MNSTLIDLPDHVEAIALCGGPYRNFAAVSAFIFAESLEYGAWTTCTAILPPREHAIAPRYPLPAAKLPVPTLASGFHARDAASSEAD